MTFCPTFCPLFDTPRAIVRSGLMSANRIGAQQPKPSRALVHSSFETSAKENQFSITGATQGTRTPDLLITNQLLYQLS